MREVGKVFINCKASMMTVEGGRVDKAMEQRIVVD